MTPRVPLWLKVGYTVWLIVWIALYKQFVGWEHFLWMCHIGNILIAVGLWRESSLLVSWQAAALLFADLLWSLDFVLGLVLGRAPIGAAWYMFGGTMPPLQKALALFHLLTPVLLIWAIRRLGYDRRAIWLQLATVCVVFPICFLVSGPKDNINWVLGPFGHVQTTVPPVAFLLVAITVYPLVTFLPSHLIACALAPRPRRPAAAAPAAADSEI